LSTPDATPRVRAARAADLRHLAGIQDAGGVLFEEHLGPDHGVEALRGAAPTGAERDAVPGFLLVVGEPVAGFVHVIVVDGEAHLEQVSVHPGHLRQGWGTALVRAATDRARREGHDRLSLSTYRDVPWNGPFYTGLGFTELDEDTEQLPVHRRLRQVERGLGLDEAGVRVVMSIPLTTEGRAARP